MTHIMLDIETLGTRPGAVVLSVAMVRFSDEAHTSLRLDRAEQVALGLVEDPQTVAWWAQQSPEAQAEAFGPGVPLRAALEHIAAWIAWAAPGGDALIWCHGATFDCPLLGAVYERAGMAPPWHYAAVRDTRTLYDLAGVNVKSTEYSVPPPHVALNDALAQTRAANAALAVLARVRGIAA